ncbi:hypothetical protein KR200_002169 [Drosophila serrata]|nr:hypothetical protein KR200_002169 [Drosophila serrata]
MVFLAISVSGESLIEVDENGDEYELKRFYIQGRQLKGDGSQSQCVVTRRKRSGRALSAGAKTGETGASVQVSSQTLNVESLPAMMEHREGAATLQEVDPSKRRYVALTGVHYEPHVPNDDDADADEDDDDDEDDDEELEDEMQAGQSPKSQSQFVPAALALPLAPGSPGEQTSAAHLPQGVSVVANAASHANVAEDAGIVVVQSHQPPKVNPDTHAVFELKPIQADVQQPAVSFYPFVHPWEAVLPEDEGDYDEEDYDEEDYDDFYYGPGGYYRDQPGYVGLGEYDEHIVSEDQPTSTTAIWSTNDDSDIHPVINQANKRPNQNKNKNKNKNNKNKNKKNSNQKNKKRVSQKKRKEETEQNQELVTQKKKNKEQKEKDQKKKQDKEQEVQEIQQDQSPVDVIKKPAAMASLSAQSSLSSSSSSMSSISNSSGSNSSVQKKKKKKKKPSSSSSSSSTSQRRTKKKKKQSSSSSSSSSLSSSGNRRRRPSSSSSSSSSIGGYRRRRPQLTQQQKRRQQQTLQQQRRRRKQQKNRRRMQQQQQQQQKRRRNRNKNRQFYGDEPIINCIYINKDPPTTTTPRPFWNILGRQSDGQNAKDAQAPGQDEPVDPVAKQAVLQAVRRNFGEFGGRKRTNLRFVA